MKKQYCILLAILFCICFALPAYATNVKPSVELSHIIFETDSAGGCSPTLYFRNNSSKTIKYYDWYFTLYNRVGDPTPDEITHDSTVHIQVIGPSEPDTPISTPGYVPREYMLFGGYYDWTDRDIVNNNKLYNVYLDNYGNYFIEEDYSGNYKITYLTDDEVQNKTFKKWAKINHAWYSNVCSYVRLQKVVVTYMDGTTEIISGPIAEAGRLDTSLHNGHFYDDVNRYRAVYNYTDYKNFNSDLASTFGSNEYAYFKHFTETGMAEGRQGSKNFNLDAYKAYNPDLVALFGNDNVKYYEHYISTGQAEGRKASYT